MDPYDYDAAVIRAAETLTDKWRAFQEGDSNEDPDNYAVALEKAVDVRRQVNSPKTNRPTEPTPTPSITVGTQVRLTGVVDRAYYDGSAAIIFEGGEISTNMDAREMKRAEVIRQPFKRGEVVWHVADGDGKGDGADYVVVNDETNGNVDVVNCRTLESFGQEFADLYERRP